MWQILGLSFQKCWLSAPNFFSFMIKLTLEVLQSVANWFVSLVCVRASDFNITKKIWTHLLKKYITRSVKINNFIRYYYKTLKTQKWYFYHIFFILHLYYLSNRVGTHMSLNAQYYITLNVMSIGWFGLNGQHNPNQYI